MDEIKKEDIFYYARSLSSVNEYDVLEVKVRAVYEGYIVCIEKRDKQAFLFNSKDIGKTLFRNRKDALNLVKRNEKRYGQKYINTNI